MYFDTLTMAAIVSELRNTILGGRVQKVVQTAPLSIGMEFYAQGRRFYLLASAHPRFARVHLKETKPTRDPQAQSPLLLHLRKRVRGAVLQEIEAPPLERILQLHFSKAKLPPEERKNTLIIEVMGRHSNLILLDRDDIVLDCIKRVPPRMSAVRPMLPSQGYRPPPQQTKINPQQISPTGLDRALAGLDPDTPLWRALTNLYLGISPLLAHEIVQRACGQGDLPLSDLGDVGILAAEIRDFWRRPEAERWEPCLALQQDRPVASAPYPLTHRPEWEVIPLAGVSQAMERYFSFHEPLGGHQQTRQILLGAIDKQRNYLQKQRASLEQELTKADRIEELRQKGEWLLAYQYEISPGQAVLRLNPSQVGLDQGVEIELDPQRSPVENAQSYFKAYRKAKIAQATLPPRIERTQQHMAWLDEIATMIHLAESHDEITLLATDLEQAGLLSPQPGRSRRKKPLSPRTFQSRDDFTILVGRNARQNQALSLKRAQHHDLWFHAQSRPGAHVIVVTKGRPVPMTTIEEAAALAAYYSQGRGEGRIAVHYTECRHIRRVPSGHPGQVRYNYERTLYVKPKHPLEENA